MSVNHNLNSNWRITASTIYEKPRDSKIFGAVELDITDLDEWIQAKRREGVKVTLTNFFTVATGRAVKSVVPELNTYIKRGKVVKHNSIDASVSLMLPSGEMTSVHVECTDKISLPDFTTKLQTAINAYRNGSENATMQNKETLAKIPWPLRSWVYALVRKLIIDWGVNWPSMGLDANKFGSYIVSNIGTLGLDEGYPALLPVGNISFVLILGSVKKKALVINDEVKIRKVINASAALDHRMVDASHAGKLFKYYKYIIQHPEELMVEV